MPLPRRSRLLPLLPALLALAASSCLPEPSVVVLSIPETARVWERFETLGHVWATYDNAFDPDEIRLDGEFVAPDGSTLIVPGFATRAYRRELVGGYEHRRAT